MGSYFSKLWNFVFPFRTGNRHITESTGNDFQGNNVTVLESSPLFTVMIIYHRPGEDTPRHEHLPLDPLQATSKVKDFLSGVFNIPTKYIQLSSHEGKLKDELNLYEQNVQHDSCLMLTDSRTS